MAKPNKENKEESKKELFSVFGEFDSYEEINQAAAGLFAEGDMESLKQLAEENGLEEDLQFYIDGATTELCDPITAAFGKLKVEKEQAKGDCVTTVIIEYLEANCDDVELALAIRKKGKRAGDMYEIIEDEARKNKKGYTGVCSDARAFQLTREYYRGGVRA